MNSLVHIYCGDGKGKTTAAMGLAIRAAGSGAAVVIARFLKNDDSGEVGVLKTIPGIHLLPCERRFGFTWTMSPEEKKAAGEYYTGLFKRAWELACDLVRRQEEEQWENDAAASGAGGVRALLVLDEIMAAVNGGFVAERLVTDALDHRPEGLEVALTGRSPSEGLIFQADYVTEMRAVKHPYEKGVGARKGVEY